MTNSNFLKKSKDYILRHKKLSILALVILVGLSYWLYQRYWATDSSASRYVIAAVDKGTIVSTVTGTGQVAASKQLELKSKTSGEIIFVGVSVGQKVSAGTLIAQVEAKDSAIALENARIALQKLTKPADKVDLAQAENSLNSAKETLDKSYSNAYNTVSNSFLDMTSIIDDLDNLLNTRGSYLYEPSLQASNEAGRNYRTSAARSFDAAKIKFRTTEAFYKTVTRTSSPADIENLVSQTYDSAKSLAQAVKDAKIAVDYLKNQELSTSSAASAQTDLAAWTNKIVTNTENLLSIKNSIESGKRDVTDKTLSLEKIKEGADPLDIRSKELDLQQKENAYNDSFIRAPFTGVVARVDVEKNDTVSNGTVVGILTSENQIAEVSLNEVDAAKVKVGQKATLTFDAVEDLSITGKVSSIDQVGTVSQGVVNYTVKIAFDVQDARIKPGMSVSADIAVDTRQDVLVVPSSAIKVNGGNYYVESFGNSVAVTGETGAVLSASPEQISVTVGSSDDTNTEIISGLKVGDKIVTTTVSGSASKTAGSLTSLLGIGGRQRTVTGGSRTNNSSNRSTGQSASVRGGLPGGPGF